jgi:hypothetical protein
MHGDDDAPAIQPETWKELLSTTPESEKVRNRKNLLKSKSKSVDFEDGSGQPEWAWAGTTA